MKIAIAGRQPDTVNYVKYIQEQGHEPLVTLEPEKIACCHGLILPGGGDITPAFFGELNRGSQNIDTELDILQLQSLDLCIKRNIPVLGICKGIQIINVGLGGTLYQDMPSAKLHRYEGCDQYHAAVAEKGSWIFGLYGENAIVNSAHHQAIKALGHGLRAVQRCPADGCIEAVVHNELPILGVQWHPERLDSERAGISGGEILAYFVSMASHRDSTYFA